MTTNFVPIQLSAIITIIFRLLEVLSGSESGKNCVNEYLNIGNNIHSYSKFRVRGYFIVQICFIGKRAGMKTSARD
jgi:hypothetical protein